MENDMRFSDERLQAFYTSWKEHREQVDQHIFKFNDHIDREELRWDELIEAVEENARMIREHREESRQLLELYNTGSAGIRILGWIGRFAKWLAGLSIFIGLYHVVVEHLSHGGGHP